MATDPLPYARQRAGTQPPPLYPDYASTVKRAPKRPPIRWIARTARRCAAVP